MGVVILLLLTTVVFSFPSVQTATAKRAAVWFNKQYDQSLTLETFRYVFPNQLKFNEVYIPDEEGDTLIYTGKLDFYFTGFNSVTNTLGSGEIEIKKLRFNWLKKEGAEEFNFKKFIQKFSSKDSVKSKPPFGLEVDDIKISDGLFHYEDFNCDSCDAYFLKDIDLDIDGFDLNGDYVEAEVKSLSFKDEYSFRVKQLKGELAYQENYIEARNLNLETERTKLVGDFRLDYPDMEAFSSFLEKVRITADIEEGSVADKDIQVFASKYTDFGTVLLKGKFKGPVNQLEMKDLALEFGKNTSLEGEILLKDPSVTDSLFVNSSKMKFSTITEDVEWFYGLFSDTTLPSVVASLGQVDFEGSFNGYLKDFSTKGEVTTEVGKVKANLSMSNLKNAKKAFYKGSIELDKIDLGILVNDTSLGLINGLFEVDGNGLNPATMASELKARVSLLQFNQYNYSGITIDGRIDDGKFNGDLNIEDPNLEFDFRGFASFTGDTSTYDFVSQIKSADLYALNLADDTISFVTSELDIDFKALNYDKWAGTIKVTNSTYENSNNYYFFQDILIASDGMDTNRTLSINSNILDGKLEGNYTLKGVADVFQYHTGKYFSLVKKVKPPEKENFSFELSVKNTLVVSEILIPELDIEPGSSIKGRYLSEGQQLDIDIISKGVRYDKYLVKNADLNYSGGEEKSRLAFNISEMSLPTGFQIDSIRLANFYYRDTLFYTLKWILRDSIDSRSRFKGFAIQEDSLSFLLGVNKSGFNIGNEDFEVNSGNRIRIDTGGIHIENLQINNKERQLAINGNISDNPHEILRLNLRGFGIDLANYFIASPQARFGGELYGNIILSQLLGSPRFAANLKIDSMMMNNTALGDLELNSDWSLKNDSIKISANMMLGELNTMTIDGFYQPDSLGSINFDIIFDHFRLVAFNPLLDGIAENLRGFLSGGMHIKGNTGSPEITGTVTLPKVAFTVSFLQTDYNLTGTPTVEISENKISFPRLKLKDSRFGTEGTLSGDITHNNFSDVNLDLRVDGKELLALNTTSSGDDAYYGTAFIGGSVYLKGPPDELKISAVVTTERETQFNIPIGGATEVGKSGFVNFVSNEEDTLKIEQNRLIVDKGISIDFDISVDQDAELNIIIDEQTGNRLFAKGDGNIKLSIDPYSDMQLFGIYTVAEGEYQFNIEGMFNKKFKVQRGGTVTWNGDPYNANLNLQALYTTKADPGIIVPQYNGGNTLVEVYLNLSGPLSNPDISFDIKTPRAGSNTQTVISNRLTDEQQTNQQVFSLLATNSFAPENSFVGGSGLGINEWDLLTSQAEAWINQLTGDYNITLDYQGNSQSVDPSAVAASQEEVEVGVSTQFFNDRVTVNGSVGVPLGENQNEVAGDFEIEYSITEDGRFRTKVFNRSVQDQYSFSQQNQQGLGFFYRLDFDSWNNFIPKLVNRNKEAKKEEEPTEEKEPEESK